VRVVAVATMLPSRDRLHSAAILEQRGQESDRPQLRACVAPCAALTQRTLAANLCTQQCSFLACEATTRLEAVAGMLVGGFMGTREPQLPPARLVVAEKRVSSAVADRAGDSNMLGRPCSCMHLSGCNNSRRPLDVNAR
jgi:hypothetical protein